MSLAVEEGKSLGIVGESGSGKSTALNLLLGLTRPESGRVLFEGAELSGRDAVRRLRRAVQPVFQDPFASLDPRMRIDRIVTEPLVSLGIERTGAVLKERVRTVLAEVGLGDDTLKRYPHEFSGGQRQRIAIARALVTDPRVLIADEPVSALDVTTRIDVIELLGRLQKERGLSVVMVSHDMSVVAALCERVLVLRDGAAVETGKTLRVLAEPVDPYTKALIGAIPACRRNGPGIRGCSKQTDARRGKLRKQGQTGRGRRQTRPAGTTAGDRRDLGNPPAAQGARRQRRRNAQPDDHPTGIPPRPTRPRGDAAAYPRACTPDHSFAHRKGQTRTDGRRPRQPDPRSHTAAHKTQQPRRRTTGRGCPAPDASRIQAPDASSDADSDSEAPRRPPLPKRRFGRQPQHTWSIVSAPPC
ncbi:ABC transporter ATP-binding protein [Tessaracoccus coleopterorum]|uniref:ABC transporter ATP-binding protein n=1 Tax=Tessaracoccus coleopterorum TaxID=2714950 RepID=UPI002F916C72